MTGRANPACVVGARSFVVLFTAPLVVVKCASFHTRYPLGPEFKVEDAQLGVRPGLNCPAVQRRCLGVLFRNLAVANMRSLRPTPAMARRCALANRQCGNQQMLSARWVPRALFKFAAMAPISTPGASDCSPTTLRIGAAIAPPLSAVPHLCIWPLAHEGAKVNFASHRCGREPKNTTLLRS